MSQFYSVSSRANVALNEQAKHLLYKMHCERGAIARDADGNTRPLAQCRICDVRFVADLWRIQNKFEHKIQFVRDKEFVLLEKINRTESNLFEFWRARMVGRNCYGRYFVGGDNLAEPSEHDYVIAKYETDNKTFFAYGPTITEARAFLGIRLYDEYQELIHSVACKNKIQQQ